MAPDFDSYVDMVRARLVGGGFKAEDPARGAALQARRRRVKLTRFGLVETVVGLSGRRGEAGPEDLRAFGRDVFASALAGKAAIPRGLGGSLVVYPVLVVDRASPELRAAVSEEPPKHWAALEFPVVAELSAGGLLFFDRTPFWGAAYYRRTRDEAQDLFALPEERTPLS
jgi:hypothetical protein